MSARGGLPQYLLDQDVGRCGGNRTAVAREPGIGDPSVRQVALDADPVAAERVDVLERRVGVGERPSEPRVAEALTDHVAVEGHVYSRSRRQAPSCRWAGNE